jgi:hypothetical protein
VLRSVLLAALLAAAPAVPSLVDCLTACCPDEPDDSDCGDCASCSCCARLAPLLPSPLSTPRALAPQRSHHGPAFVHMPPSAEPHEILHVPRSV